MDVGFCVMAFWVLRHGIEGNVGVLRDPDIRISMDRGGRWMDNGFIERPWRSLRYECVYPAALVGRCPLRQKRSIGLLQAKLAISRVG